MTFQKLTINNFFGETNPETPYSTRMQKKRNLEKNLVVVVVV